MSKALAVIARDIAKDAIAEYSTNAVEKHRIRAGQHVSHDHPAFQAALAALRHFDPVADVQAFHEKFAIHYHGKPRALAFELLQFRLKFLREEINEFEKHGDALNFILDESQTSMIVGEDALVVHHLDGMLDALVDLVYVALGTAHLQGFDTRAAWKRVHAANMAKVISCEATSAEHRMKLKLTKPPGWEAPDHKDLVEDNAHRMPESIDPAGVRSEDGT